MDVIALWAALVVVFLTLHVHEIKFVHQSMSLEQTQGAIDSHTIDVGIELSGVAQYLACIQMLFGRLNHAQNGSALPRHTQTA